MKNHLFASAMLTGLLSTTAFSAPIPTPTNSYSIMPFVGVGGNLSRSPSDRALDQRSALDFAKCDGTTDDSSAITSAQAGTYQVFVPKNLTCNAPSISWNSLSSTFVGPGRIKTSDGNLRAPLVTTLSSRPSTGNWSSASTAWNGDVSHVGVAHEHIITGSATLGQPTSGYLQIPEASGEILSFYNSSGFNNSTSGNGGRTGLAGKYIDLYQYGQGDLTGTQCFGVVGSVRAGATNYLASPEIACIAGGLFAGSAGQYIEFLGDMNITDNGNDIAAAGGVLNLSRSVATEGIGANWSGWRVNSSGSQPVDIGYQLAGPAIFGIDMSNANIGYYRAAGITLSSGGTGYTAGDILTVTGGTSSTPTVIAVDTVSSGVILTWHVVNTGIYTSVPVSGYSPITLTGGTGSSANFSAQYLSNNAILLPANGGCMQPAATGASYTQLIGVNASRVCINTYGVDIGNALTSNTNGGSLGANNIRLGGNHNTLGTNVTQIGSYTYDYAAKNVIVFGSGSFAGKGSGFSQEMTGILRTTTSSGTPSKRLTTDNSTASTINSFLIPTSYSNTANWYCSAVDTTVPANTAGWKLHSGFVSRPSSGNVNAYQGDASSALVPDYGTGTYSTASITISSDTTLQNLNVTFTNPTANTDAWDVSCKMSLLMTQ